MVAFTSGCQPRSRRKLAVAVEVPLLTKVTPVVLTDCTAMAVERSGMTSVGATATPLLSSVWGTTTVAPAARALTATT